MHGQEAGIGAVVGAVLADVGVRTTPWTISTDPVDPVSAGTIVGSWPGNALFTAWVEQVYHQRVHSATEMAPLARFGSSVPSRL